MKLQQQQGEKSSSQLPLVCKERERLHLHPKVNSNICPRLLWRAVFRLEVGSYQSYQSGYVWGNMLRKCIEPVPVKQWGWQQDTPQSAPTPLYTTKPVLSKKIPDLVSCKCKTPCKPPCTCKVNEKSCMLMCTCQCFKSLPVWMLNWLNICNLH